MIFCRKDKKIARFFSFSAYCGLRPCNHFYFGIWWTSWFWGGITAFCPRFSGEIREKQIFHLPKPKKCSKIESTESCPSGRRCSTRNAVWSDPPRVRIPNSPPKKRFIQLYKALFWAILKMFFLNLHMIFSILYSFDKTPFHHITFWATHRFCCFN